MTTPLAEHYRGDTFPGAQFTVLVNGVPKSLLGASIRMDVRKTATGSRALRLTSAVGGGLTITDAPNAVFKIDEQIINIAAGEYVYDIEITYSDGQVKTPIVGTWDIVQDVTYG